MEASKSITTQEVSDEELKSLTDAINQRHGIDFSVYEVKSLKRRVVRALHVFNLNAVHELWIKILREHAFIYAFMDEISVGLTAMFRDPILWRKLKYLLDSKFSSYDRLKIWHAGCSTGEEVYTMGIVLSESTFKRPVSAWATDISNQSIRTAQQGEYNALKFEEYNINYAAYRPGANLSKYFMISDQTMVMDKALISHVKFSYHNLIKDDFRETFDIIFCRNVMIYFDNKAKLNLFEKFHNALNPGGLFIIGFYDAILPMIDPLKFQIVDLDAKIFQKI